MHSNLKCTSLLSLPIRSQRPSARHRYAEPGRFPYFEGDCHISTVPSKAPSKRSSATFGTRASRSEERRDGKDSVSTCNSRWMTYHEKTKNEQDKHTRKH